MGKNKVLISVETDTKKSDRGFKRTNKNVNQLEGNLKRTGKAAIAMKVKLVAAATAIVAAVVAIKSLTKEFITFEYELGKVASLVDDNTLVFGEFAQGIRDLSVEFGQTKSTLTKGLFDIISATIEADEAMGVLRASTMLAVAGFAQTSETTSALITVYQAFRDELKDTTDAADFLFAVQKRGRLTVSSVAKTIGVVASTAKAANVTLNEFGAAFSAISRAGIGAERTVVQLAALIKVFNKPSKEAIPILEKYGVAIGNAAIANGELFKTIDKLKNARIGELNLLFVEERALRGFNNLVIRQSELHEDLASQLNRTGMVVKEMTDAQKLAQFQVDQATEQINLQKEAIGKQLTPAYIGLLKTLNTVIITTRTFYNLQRGILPVMKSFKDTQDELKVSIEETARATNKLNTALETYEERMLTLAAASQKVVQEQAKTFTDRFNADMEEGIALTESLKTEQEQLNDALARFHELRNMGAITEDTFGRANKKAIDEFEESLVALDEEIKRKPADLKLMEEAFKKQAKQVEIFEGIFDSVTRGIGTNIDGVIQGTQSMSDAFRKMTSDILLSMSRFFAELAIEELKQRMKNIFFPASSSPSFMGPPAPKKGLLGLGILGLAEGGIVPGPVGAPMPAIVHGGEEVIPPGKSSGSGTGVVQNINISPGIQGTVRAEIMAMMPLIKRVAVDAVLTARRRGGGMSRAMGARA